MAESVRLQKMMEDTRLQAEKNLKKQTEDKKGLFHTTEDKVLLTVSSVIIVAILLILAAFAALSFKYETMAFDNWWPANGPPPPAAADEQPPVDAADAAAT